MNFSSFWIGYFDIFQVITSVRTSFSRIFRDSRKILSDIFQIFKDSQIDIATNSS